MKLALISDIHGNSLALEAVLISARKHDVEKILVAGDLIGYYFWPLEVIDLLKDWECFIVKGNHEEMLYKSLSDDQFLKMIDHKYGPGLRLAIDQLSKEQLAKLIALPHPMRFSLDNLDIMLCHGAPDQIDKYIYPDVDISTLDFFTDSKLDLIIMGHTHYPMHLFSKGVEIINPGSVGQPRNSLPGAQWVLYDTEDRSATFLSERYDVGKIISACAKYAPQLPYLAKVLLRTRY